MYYQVSSRAKKEREKFYLYFQTEAQAGEYDVPKCAEVSQNFLGNWTMYPTQGTPSSMCTHEITAHFTVADMAQRCDIRKNPGCWGEDYDKTHQVTFTKIPFSPLNPGNQPDLCWGSLPCAVLHQHGAFPCRHWQAAVCSLPYLWQNSPGLWVTGTLFCFSSDTISQVFDELGYLAIPPCIWGTEEVDMPFLLNLSIFDSGGSNCAGLPSFQREPDFNQEEQ